MIPTSLHLPERPPKPRQAGLTTIIDKGLPKGLFRDYLESTSQLVDYVKFGWGTSLVTHQLADKLATLRELDIPFFFGGTLFEKFLSRSAFDDFRAYCHH
ncbi:MAG: phosphosulfolactate synthase, partial [Actinomycetota bacterium]|nr:phosphosulfolactate synthase [Actinomycetota bacterium]